MSAATHEDAAPRLRCGILAIAWLAIAGTGIELAIERHWQNPLQFIAWVALLLAVLAAALASRAGASSSARRTRVTRIVASLVLALSLVGVVRHVVANYEAGELDQFYAARWPTMSESARWRAAALKQVGPAPILAAGVLVNVALLVLLSTARPTHPGGR